MGLEIERKWLVDGMPVGKIKYMGQMQTWYFSTEPEIRLRKYEVNGDVKYLFTFKTVGTLSRVEIEQEITEEEMLACISDLPINLMCQPIKDDFIKLDIDGHDVAYIEVDGKFNLIEIEFATEEEALAYVPTFDGIEVTDNSEYYKRNYWKKTRLEA